MTKKEALWFGLFVVAFGMVAVPRGWKAVVSNMGLAMVGWIIGRALR